MPREPYSKVDQQLQAQYSKMPAGLRRHLLAKLEAARQKQIALNRQAAKDLRAYKAILKQPFHSQRFFPPSVPFQWVGPEADLHKEAK